MVNIITQLDKAIQKVAPIDGVSIGRYTDKSTWRIDFKPSATAQQRLDAESILQAFDVSVEEQKQKDASKGRDNKRKLIVSNPNKAVTVQDLLDLGIVQQ